jgi:uncharacterized protein (TIGR03437 family)
MNWLKRSGIRVFFILFAALAQAQPTTSPAERIREIDRALAGAPADRLVLLAQREQSLYELIALDPDQALALGSLNPARLAAATSWTGSLAVLVADDFEAKKSRTIYKLYDAQDGEAQLYFAEEHPKASAASITVEGIRVGDRIAVREAQIRAAGPTSCSLTGPQQTAVMMVTTTNNPAFPAGYTREYFEKRFFGGPHSASSGPSVDVFMRENSYDQASVTGKVFDVHMPRTLPTVCEDDSFFRSVIAAAGAQENLDAYSRYFLVFPAASSCGYGGIGLIGCRTFTNLQPVGPATASASWIPIRPFYFPGDEASIFNHEYGHNWGMLHARSQTFEPDALGPIGAVGEIDEYGDIFDTMGDSSGQYSAAHKTLDLGWLKSGETATVTQSGIYNLIPLESNAGVRGLRILRDADTNSWLWAEFRQPIGEAEKELENYLDPYLDIFEGVTLRLEPPDAPSGAAKNFFSLLDFTPDTPYFDDGLLLSGQSWSDPYSPLRLTVVGKDQSQLSLKVDYDRPCSHAEFAEEPAPSSAGGGTIMVTAPADCSWSAASASSWITLNGVTEGKGNGLVTFEFTANSSDDPRTGSVVINRANARVLQAGRTTNTVVRMVPSQGSGSSQIFVVRIARNPSVPLQEAKIVDISFGDLGGCVFVLNGESAQFIVGVTLSQPLALNSGTGSIKESMCTLHGEDSAYRVTASEIIYQFHMSFDENAVGTYRIWVVGGQRSDGVPVGHWTVPDCIATLQETDLTVPYGSASRSVAVTSGSTCRWTALGQGAFLHTHSSGVGDGAVEFTLAENLSAKPRTAAITLSGNRLTVTQQGQPVQFALKPGSRTISPPAATGELELTGTLDAPWTVVSSAPWLIVTSPASGENHATVAYRVEANTQAQSRSATLTVGNAKFTITQLGTAVTGITSVQTVGGGSDISPNAWIQIKGHRLVPTNTPAAGVDWSTASSFAQGRMPTELQGIRVTVNGRPAYVYFYCSAVTATICSEDQINVLTPLEDAVGLVEVVVFNGTSASPPYIANRLLRSPALMQFDAARHIIATHADGSIIGPRSLYPGVSTPAEWFEHIVVYSVGWGVASSALAEGSVAQSGTFPGLTCTVDGIQVTPTFAGLVSPGLTQINLRVPFAFDDEVPVSCKFEGYTVAVEAMLAIE